MSDEIRPRRLETYADWRARLGVGHDAYTVDMFYRLGGHYRWETPDSCKCYECDNCERKRREGTVDGRAYESMPNIKTGRPQLVKAAG